MWGSLIAAVVVLALFAYGPSFLLLRGLGMRRSRAIAAAPLCAIVVYSLLAVVYAKVGVESSWATLAIPFAVVGGLVFAIGTGRRVARRRIETISPSPQTPPLTSANMAKPLFSFVLYLAVGVCAVVGLFAARLGEADAFICGFDIAHHMSSVRAFVESGNWSMLEVTLFPGEPGEYYPSANALLAALIVSCLDVPVTLSLNAENIVLAGIVFPLGMWCLMARIFGWRDARTFVGAFCSVIFVAFPWELFTRSAPVLYAYVLALGLLPGFIVLLMDCFEAPRDACAEADPVSLFGRFAAAVMALAAVAFAHPSAFFSAVVFIICYIAYVLIVRTRSLPLARRVLAVGGWLVLCAAVWFALYKAPFMQSVVTCEYGARGGLVEGLARIAIPWSPHVGAQYVLAIVVLVGLIGCLLDKRRRWLIAPYALMAVLALGCMVVPPSPLRFLLSGFWYNHLPRLTATLAIFSMPIAAQGFGLIMHLADRAMARIGAARRKLAAKSPSARWQRRLSVGPAGVVVAAILLALIVFLRLPLPQATSVEEFGGVMERQNDPAYKTSYLKQDERDFLLKAVAATTDGGRVLNVPHDGSAYAYGWCGLNTTGRTPAVYSDEKKALLADCIDQIATDDEVAAAAEELGVEYVLLLDVPGGKKSSYYGSFDESYWQGVYAIDDDTPGFEVVLADSDMRLYRIVR